MGTDNGWRTHTPAIATLSASYCMMPRVTTRRSSLTPSTLKPSASSSYSGLIIAAREELSCPQPCNLLSRQPTRSALLRSLTSFTPSAFLQPIVRTLCVRFAVGPSWLLTASEKRPKFFDDFVQADQGETLKGKMTATAFMASLLMRHLDGFREEIAGVDVAIDKLDDAILRGREKRSPLAALAALRRRLANLRTILKTQRSVIHGLVAPDFVAHVSDTDRDFLVEVNRMFERLEDDVGRARETIIGSFELYASRVAQDTNQLVKVLTIATVITGVIGAVAGVFGMNFDTPFAHSGLQGFLLVTGAMVAASVGIILLALWRRWV